MKTLMFTPNREKNFSGTTQLSESKCLCVIPGTWIPCHTALGLLSHTGQICHCKEAMGMERGQKSQYFRSFKSHSYNTINVLSFMLPEKKVEENKHSFANIFYVCVRMDAANLASSWRGHCFPELQASKGWKSSTCIFHSCISEKKSIKMKGQT